MRPKLDTEAFLNPRSIAIVGASATRSTVGNRYIRTLRGFGYDGDIHVIHRDAASVDGLPTVKSLADIPSPVDLAFVCVAADQVAAVLAQGALRVKVALIASSGFSETTGDETLDRAVLDEARRSGIRLIGPNCLGIHSSRGRITFIDDAPAETGPVAVISQSGGLSIDILQRGRHRGIAFHSLVTVGNSLDIDAVELLGPLVENASVGVVGLYLEGVKDGRALAECLRRNAGKKHIVLLKSGRTPDGQRAIASHTGALAGGHEIWQGLARQFGVAMADTLDEFIDLMLAFQHLAPRRDAITRDVVLFGNGGGASVLAVDAFVAAGFRVPALDSSIVAELKDRFTIPSGASVANPIDVPGSVLRNTGLSLAILNHVAGSKNFDALIVHVNLGSTTAYEETSVVDSLIEAAIAARNATGRHVLFVLRGDGTPAIEAVKSGYRQKALLGRIPVFDELPASALALRGIQAAERGNILRMPIAADSAGTFAMHG